MRYILLILVCVLADVLFAQEWNQFSNIPISTRNNALSFTIGDSVYVGSGYDGALLYNDLWVYDKRNDQWYQRANLPVARENGAAFSIGNKGYAGFGWNLNASSSLSSVYEFDPSTNSWSAIAPYPGSGGRGVFAASVSGKGYAGGGGVGRQATLQRDFWEYNPGTNSWTQKANLPFGRRTGGIAFGVNNYIYLGFGHDNNSDFNDFWRFDPLTNSWTQVASCPGVGRLQPEGFIVNGKIIIGGGHRLGAGTLLNDYYEYDPTTNSWRQICGIPTGGRSNHTAFSIADTGYVTLGRLNSGTTNELWQLVPLPTTKIDTAFCQGKGLLLDVFVSGGSYLWSDNSTNSTLQVSSSGTYWVQTTVNNCSRVDTFNVNQLSTPTVNLGNDTTLCDGETLTLDATNSGATYLWQDNSTNATFTVSQADTFYVAVDLNGCIATDTIIVDYQSYPIVDLGADAALCQGESLTLDATNNGATYVWQDNSTNATFTVTQAGQYWVEVTTNGCSTSDTINVNYKPLPTVSLGNDTTLCDGETLTLDATNSGATYLWQDNSTNATFTVSQADTFYVAVDLNGCIATDTIIVDYQSYPIVDLGADTTLCQGESLTLDATNSGATYAWQDNSTNSTFTVNQAGQYWVEVTTNGCSTSDTINVNYKPLPTVNLGNDTTLCDGETLTLDATNSGATYLWQDNSTNATFTVSQADTFYVAVDLNGCIATDTIIVDYQSYPIVDLGDDTTLCQGESLTLDATNSGATYAWQDNSTNATFTVNQAGQYWVEVTTNGCSTSDTINVNYKPLPTVNLGNDTTLCDGETLTLDATNSGATYLWQDNSTNATFTVSQADTFYVAVDLNGCIATDTIIVDYQSYPIVDLGADTTLCQGESLTLDATNSGATYAWQDNSTNATFTVNQAGQYWVEVTTNGCSTSDTINVNYKPLPTVNLGNDTTLCDGETLTLDATNSGATYLWQDNSTNATFTVSQADTFYVAVDLNGCIATDTIIVDYQGGLSPVFIGDTSICSDEEIELDATLALATQYLWSDNSTSSTIFVNDSGEYWVEISSLCDTLRDTIHVNLKDCACEFEAPNVFTPNGDGVNDYFYPSLKCQLVSYEMNIFNRWGDLVFYSNQPLLQWDGRVNDGKKAAEGHYMYVIEYKDVLSGQKNTEKGTFMLMY